jgi:two-component system, response regulator YesN
LLRAMLVDDEPLALEGLKLLIDWQTEGFEICGECASAGEALQKLPLLKPDLIVTDIRMPGMSGLELLTVSREAGFDGQFVIVSGYSDFNYARSALQIGVAGYLLKPVEPADAAAVLAHVRRKLIDRDVLANQRPEAVQNAISALLTDGDTPVPDLPKAARWILATWGAPLPYPDVQALLAPLKNYEATSHIVEDKEYLVLRMQTKTAAPEFGKADALLKRLNRQLIFAKSTGNPADLPALRKILSDQLDMACRNALSDHVDALVRAVSLRQADECSARCAQLESFCAACGTNAAVRARRQLISACAAQLADREDALKTFLASQDAGLPTLCQLAIQLLAPQQERVSDAMKRYALEHNHERVTVSGIASALKYNATYLGRKFHEEQGIEFREWLENHRVEQSAALLRGTNRSVIAIAKAVGYDQYKRFLRHFKQRFGVTPEQYRRQSRN